MNYIVMSISKNGRTCVAQQYTDPSKAKSFEERCKAKGYTTEIIKIKRRKRK